MKSIPYSLQFLLELYESGCCPPDEQTLLAQGLIDTGLNEELHGQLQQLCDYFIAEGLCYDVGYIEDTM